MKIQAGLVFLSLLVLVACTPAGPLPTLVPSADLAEIKPTATQTPRADKEQTDTPYPSVFPTPTVTPHIMCTPPACNEGEIYYCPGDCPGGCGTLCATITPRNPGENEGRVVEVIDGDTFDVDIDGTVYRVLYIGIDATGQGMPFHQEVKDANADLVAGETVTLVRDESETDQFDRLLRHVYLEDGRMVSAELARLGYARQASHPPNVTHDDLFLQLMVQARASEVGLWASPPTESPPPPTNTPLAIPTNTPASLPTNTPIP